MNPRDLENRAVNELHEAGYITQKALFSLKHLPSGRVISNQADFFNIWDIIAVKEEECRLIQVCSGTTFRAHELKIKKSGFPLTSWASQELWYYFKEGGRWKHRIEYRTIIGWVGVKIGEMQ